MDSFTKINDDKLKELKEYMETYELSETNMDDDVEIIFDKEKYTKFYTIIGYVITYIMTNSYTVLISDAKTIDEVKICIKNTDKLSLLLKQQLKYYWNLNDNSQMCQDLNELQQFNIVRHKICLFKLIRGLCMFVIDNINKIDLVFNSVDEVMEKLSKLIYAFLEIEKISILEDEDEISCDTCDGCYDVSYEDFWM